MTAAPVSGLILPDPGNVTREVTRPKLRLPQTITTDDELYWAVRYFFGISIPRVKVCEDHVAPFTAFADAFFARDSITDPDNPKDASICLWHGSRGLSGKSYSMSGLGLALATFLAADVNLLGGSFEQSVNIKKHMDAMRYFEDAPDELFGDWGTQQINFPNGVYIRPLTASQRTVRGPHPPRLLLDEIDEMDLEILEAALGQPMEKKTSRDEIVYPYTVMCSTWQNPDGTFTEILRRAEEKGWPIYRWCYRESNNKVDGWLSDRQVEEKRHSIGEEMWRVEYDLGEPSIGNRAFDTDCVDAMFVKDVEPIRKKVETNLEEYVYADPKKGRRYVVAADWGKEQDKTVISVFDYTNPRKRRLVYFLRVNRRPWPLMIGYYNDAIKRYRCESDRAIHDGTGLGNTVADYVDTRAWGFTFTGEKRTALLSEWVAAVESTGLYEIPRIGSAYTEHKYCRVGDLWSTAKAQGFHLPDTVASFAMAHRAIGQAPPPVAPQAVPKAKGDGPATYIGRALGDKDPAEARDTGVELSFGV